MNYTVVWQPTAENQLATAWVDATDRGAVARASDRVDRVLAVDPAHEGESRDRGRRLVFVPPLAVTYEVIEDDKLVRILRVRLRERPARG